MNQGTLSLTQQIDAPCDLVYHAWTALEHRTHWFVGPQWKEIHRALDLRPGGSEIAHGVFPNGIETLYTAHFHLIEPNVRLIYDFDMCVGGNFFSSSLAAVEFKNVSGQTELSYTEHGFFLVGDYDADSRTAGTKGLLDQFSQYIANLNSR